jgi:hypothetical protein
MIRELLQKKKDAIVRRWLDAVLATYPEEASAAFKRQKDPFANPVGHSLRVGTRRIFEAMLDGMDIEEIRHHLDAIIKIRAVQQLPPSQAVCFVFPLKEAVRAELGQAIEEPPLAAELTALEAEIDRIALVAFDIFVACREQVWELRVSEVKRRVSWVVDKMNERDSAPQEDRINLE